MLTDEQILEAHDMFLRSVESHGPGDFESWEQSWRTYCAGWIRSTLDAYHDLMFPLHACTGRSSTRLFCGLVWSNWNNYGEKVSFVGDTPNRGACMSSPDRIIRRPKRQRHQHNVGDDGFLVTSTSGYSLCPAGRTALAVTAIPRCGAGVYWVRHTNLQNASPKNNAQRLPLHEASAITITGR